MTLIFLFESVSTSFANSDYNYDQSEDSLIIGNNKIDIVENSNTSTSIITDLKNGEKNNIIYYKNEGKIYSSFTKKTFNVEKDKESVVTSNFISSDLASYSNSKDYTKVSYGDVKFSYKELSEFGGGLVGIAGGIVAILSGIGITVPSVLKVLEGVGTTIIGGVNMAHPSDDHGIVMRVRREKIYRNGQLYDLRAYPLSIGTY